AAEEVTTAETAAREKVEHAQGLQARAEALQEALDEAHARAGVETLADRAGVLGTLLDVVEVEGGYERAFEAAVDEALGAVVVAGREEARQAIEHLHANEVLGAVLAVEPAGGRGLSRPPTGPPPGCEYLRERVRPTRPAVGELLDRLLGPVVVCRGGLASALDATGSFEVVVTLEGDRFSGRGWRLGAGRVGATASALDSVRSESELAREHAAAAAARAELARQTWSAARGRATEASRALAARTAEERQVAAEAEETSHRIETLAGELAFAEAAHAERLTAAERLEDLLSEREEAAAQAELAESNARKLADDAVAGSHRLAEHEAVLAGLRADLERRAAAVEERRRVLTERRDEIEDRLAGFAAAREQAGARRRAREAEGLALGRIAEVVASLARSLATRLGELRAERSRHDGAVRSITERLATARSDRASAEHDLSVAREHAQRNELERAELRVRLESALEMLRHDLEVEPAEAIAAECPELPPGTAAPARVRELERELRLLGPINPLALEELAVLEERDSFLSNQLEDVRSARRELAKVMRAVDQEIVSVFSEAFADVAGHFEDLFSTLFPGGAGRLSLVDPGDLLGSGIEIEARPAGRNIRRLSLLSGGERSLAALAFLFAVFRSRPSPFYLMDEVEAALDDVNLHRFLDLVDEFRSEAQLVIVSHH
ncbi:MAG: AAA family ATPase, partial [Acidimicrobiales bacterium]